MKSRICETLTQGFLYKLMVRIQKSLLLARIQVLFLQEVESDYNGATPKGTSSKLKFGMFLPQSLDTTAQFVTECKYRLDSIIL